MDYVLDSYVEELIASERDTFEREQAAPFAPPDLPPPAPEVPQDAARWDACAGAA